MTQLSFLNISMLAVALSLTACGNDSDNSTTTPPNVVEQQQTISGFITDADGNPLNEAYVTIGNQTITTSSTGAYTATLTDPKSKTVVLVKKSGYLTTAREVMVRSDQSYKLDVTLTSDQVTTAFAANAGINELAVSGAKVSIPANAIVNADGSSYTGTVNIAANYYSPDSLQGARAFAQPFAGQDEDGSDRTNLITVGVIDVKLTDPATGVELDLKEDTIATLVYPEVSTDQNLPTIPLWYYDEEKTIWVKDGVATRQTNGSYKGLVSHFTLWNLDIPLNEYYALVEGCVIDVNTKKPYIQDNFGGQITGRGSFFSAGAADSKGKFSIKVPFNTPLTLSASPTFFKFDTVQIPALAQNATYQINNGKCIEIGTPNSDDDGDLNGNTFDELPSAPETVTSEPEQPAPPTFETPTEENKTGLIGYSFDFETDSDKASGLENILFNTLSATSGNTLEFVEKPLYKGQDYSDLEPFEAFLLTSQGISPQNRFSLKDNKYLKIKQLNTTFINNQYTQRLSNGFVSTGTYTDMSLSGQKIGDVFAFENNDIEGYDYYNDIPNKVIEKLNNLPNALSTFDSNASCKKPLTGNVNMDYIDLQYKLPDLSFEQAIAGFNNTNFKRGTWAGIPWISETIAEDDDDDLIAFVNYENAVYAASFVKANSDALLEVEKDNCEFYNEAAKNQILEAISAAYPTL